MSEDNTPANQQPKRTPLYDQHSKLEAKIVDFGGWALPVNYGSQVEEHHAVRRNCGMFDVSHMTVTDITGIDTLSFLSKILANNIDKATTLSGKALYSCMLNENGGVIDDLIVYYLNDQHCRLVTNASTNERDMAWIQAQANAFTVDVAEKPELALLAVQGPNAIEQVKAVVAPEFAERISSLKRFQGVFHEEHFVGRTGYTGEDGVEFIVGADYANELWESLIDAKVQPCGLGARDTLRLEAGMALYGNDLDEEHTPLDSGLKWTVSLTDDRDFIGKAKIESPSKLSMIGLILEDRGVLRGHQKVFSNETEIGEITSGTFSPSLEKSIALARVNTDSKPELDSTVSIAVRNKMLTARVVKYPFI